MRPKELRLTVRGAKYVAKRVRGSDGGATCTGVEFRRYAVVGRVGGAGVSWVIMLLRVVNPVPMLRDMSCGTHVLGGRLGLFFSPPEHAPHLLLMPHIIPSTQSKHAPHHLLTPHTIPMPLSISTATGRVERNLILVGAQQDLHSAQ